MLHLERGHQDSTKHTVHNQTKTFNEMITRYS